MGTIFQAEVHAADREAAQRLAEAALAVAEHWEDVLTTWRPDGELAVLNSRAGAGWQPVSDDLGWALDEMLAYERRSKGAFNAAVGTLVRELGTGVQRGVEPVTSHRPLSAVLARRPGTANLAPGIEIDPGGIGKGMALDAAAVALHDGGATAAFLNFGGSSHLAMGAEIRDASRLLAAGLLPGEAVGVIRLERRALSTSRSPASSAARPIVDPRNSRAVTERRIVTVASASATAAEVWSTALVVLGRDGIGTAERAGVDVLFVDVEGSTSTKGFPLENLELRE